jgi:hypothetical protein
VISDLAVAGLLGALYLAYDVALTRGARLLGGDLRTLAAVVLVAAVVGVGSLVTYLVVPQPGAGRRVGIGSARSPWSAALGFFAGIPIAYLTLVVVVQILKPLFT